MGIHFRDNPLDTYRTARKLRDRILKRKALMHLTPYEAGSVIAMNRVMLSMRLVILDEMKAAIEPAFLDEVMPSAGQDGRE